MFIQGQRSIAIHTHWESGNQKWHTPCVQRT